MDDQQSDGQSPCCEGADCCPRSGSREGKRSNRWKTLVFTTVILLAGAVTAYSLFWRDRGAGSSSCCGTASAGCATPCGAVTPIAGFDEQLEGTDFALAVFLPAGCEFPQRAGEVVHEVITELEAKGAHVQVLYLSPADSTFAKAADRYKITGCPTVLVHTKGGNAVLAQDGISKDAILSIYEQSRIVVPINVTLDARQPR